MTGRRLELRLATLVLALGVTVGCSSDGDGGDGRSGSGPDAALARRECYLGLEVPGVEHEGFSCSGGDSYSSVGGLVPNTFGAAVNLYLSLANPPAAGPLAMTALTIEVPDEDAVKRWEADVDACTATAVDSAVDEDFGWVYFRIDISCTEPALPVESNPDPPLQLGDFTIVTFFAE